jgi:S1-C subfamily serine protease
MPFNNVPTIQDFLGGQKTMSDILPHTRGNWATGKDVDKSYKEKGSDYRSKEEYLGRMLRDREIQERLVDKDISPQKWKVKVPGGSKSFLSFELAQRYIREKGIPFRYLSRIAQTRRQEEAERVEVIGESINKCFLVESIDIDAGVKETGSAFCIAPNYFITCAHVLKNYDKNKLKNNLNFRNTYVNLIKQGNTYRASVAKVDSRLDIALLKCDVDVEPFKLDTVFSVGEDIIAIGSPHGYENNVSTGNIGSLDRKLYTYKGAPDYMFVDLSIFPGNSGGPVIKVDNGNVVGMVTLIVTSEGGYGLNAALSSVYIEKFCKGILF